jgi:hypothetical protein
MATDGTKIRTALWQVISIAVLATAFGCKSSPSKIVVLDSWWDVDYAKSMCQLAQQINGGCYEDGRPQVLEFESNLATEFATEEVCKSLRLATFSGPKSANEAYKEIISRNAPYWWLMISLEDPEKLTGHWSISYRDDHDPKNAKGFEARFDNSSREIATRVCRIVKGQGADVAPY